MAGRRSGRAAGAALRALRSADPIPTAAAGVPAGPGFVSYVGGTTEAARLLSGMDGPPPTSLRRSAPAEYSEQLRAWRSASRQAQRLARAQTTRDPWRTLDERKRKQAQALNRDRKRTATRAAGIRVQVQGVQIVVGSAGANRRDTRTRSILHDPAGGLGVLIPGGAILDLMAAGDAEAAAELLQEELVDACGFPPTADVTVATGHGWVIWADGEPAPGDALL